MAGGRGERLRPLTDTCPKPLLPVAGRPVLDRLLEKLAEAGIQDVTLAVGYLGPMIEDYVLDGARWGVRADYVRQLQPMGTAGALSLLPRFKQCVLVINGDKVFEQTNDLITMCWIHPAERVVVGTVPHQMSCGVIIEGRLWERPRLPTVAGIYRLPHHLANQVNDKMDMPDLIGALDVAVHYCQGYVLDIGTPQSYEAACARLS